MSPTPRGLRNVSKGYIYYILWNIYILLRQVLIEDHFTSTFDEAEVHMHACVKAFFDELRAKHSQDCEEDNIISDSVFLLY